MRVKDRITPSVLAEADTWRHVRGVGQLHVSPRTPGREEAQHYCLLRGAHLAHVLEMEPMAQFLKNS